MAAAADSAEGLFASRAGRALAFGCSFTACLLAAGVLTITVLGRPGGPARATLDQDRFASLKSRRVLDRPDGGDAGQRHRGSLQVR